VVVAWFSIKWFVEPIQRINLVAKEIAEGNFEKEIRASSRDELGDLADSINFMAKRLEATIDDITEEKNRAHAILDCMGDGVIVLDEHAQIILVNPAAEEFFGIIADYSYGKDILEVVRNYELDKLLTTSLNTGESMVQEMRVLNPDQRIFCVHVTPLICPECRVQKAGVVALLRDITERRALEEMRSEFIANVSHELRTPLTTIKGYLETLLDGALEEPELSRHFLEVVNSEAERFARLIDDLLDLSKMENRRAVINCTQPVRIADLINRITTMYESQASEKGLQLVTEVGDPTKLVVQGDPDMLSQVMINLVDNAIKYTPEGGEVTVRAFPSPGKGQEKTITVQVEDTGIGIPKDSVPRIFERFYRVDKSRWRELGGSGLGLSIVKHIIEAHGGEVDIQSTVGKGSVFTFTLSRRVQKH
ncbi:MAG TPA: ATP-binding protein, partial [Clostridia bacterium]|nr:ATP-binding protein [Clostridia bacterium]